MKRNFFSLLTGVTVTLALVACGSTVKLDDVPVETRTGAAVGAQKSVDASGASSRSVMPIKIDDAATNLAGPASATKIIYFDYDSYTIKPEFQGALEIHARFLGANQARKLVIEGHTDERGGREYNLALGQKRAEAVRRAFALLGVSDAQMEAVSLGKEKPASDGVTEDVYAKNRRAELGYR